jgi:hypothetical protein
MAAPFRNLRQSQQFGRRPGRARGIDRREMTDTAELHEPRAQVVSVVVFEPQPSPFRRLLVTSAKPCYIVVCRALKTTTVAAKNAATETTQPMILRIHHSPRELGHHFANHDGANRTEHLQLTGARARRHRKRLELFIELLRGRLDRASELLDQAIGRCARHS